MLDAAYDPATRCLTRSSANLVQLDQHTDLMSTVGDVKNVTVNPAQDVLPNATGPGGSCPNGVSIDMAKGTDRGQPATPARVQAFTDLAESEDGDSDLLRAEIQSFDATTTGPSRSPTSTPATRPPR